MPSRRDFLIQSSAAVVASSAMAQPEQRQDTNPKPRGILRLNLRTSKLSELRTFYRDTLKLPLTTDKSEQLTIQAGSTELTFTPADGDPFYHFAFNIPENQLAASKRWLISRGIEVLRKPGSSHSQSPDEYHFESWNAHAIYFLDPAGNILEFIARHNLKNASDGDFTESNILYASEIGIVVDDVRTAAERAASELELNHFVNPPSDKFAAIGDDHRLLIIVKKGRPWNIAGNRTAAIFPTQAVLAGREERTLSLPEALYTISTESSL